MAGELIENYTGVRLDGSSIELGQARRHRGRGTVKSVDLTKPQYHVAIEAPGLKYAAGGQLHPRLLATRIGPALARAIGGDLRNLAGHEVEYAVVSHRKDDEDKTIPLDQLTPANERIIRTIEWLELVGVFQPPADDDAGDAEPPRDDSPEGWEFQARCWASGRARLLLVTAPEPDGLHQPLAQVLLTAADRVQQSLRPGSPPSRGSMSHSRARGAVEVALDVVPLPNLRGGFKARQDAVGEWGRQLLTEALTVFQVAVKLPKAADPAAAAEQAGEATEGPGMAPPEDGPRQGPTREPLDEALEAAKAEGPERPQRQPRPPRRPERDVAGVPSERAIVQATGGDDTQAHLERARKMLLEQGQEYQLAVKALAAQTADSWGAFWKSTSMSLWRGVLREARRLVLEDDTPGEAA